MNNPLQDYLNDLMTLTEKAMPQFKPTCRDCGDPIEGIAYNHRCGSCHQQLRREERQEWEQQQ